jgi:hypothetical protein
MSNSDSDTETETETDRYKMPPEAYSATEMEDTGLVQRNEFHNWVTSTHVEIQTELLRQQNELLIEIRDELQDG